MKYKRIPTSSFSAALFINKSMHIFGQLKTNDLSKFECFWKTRLAQEQKAISFSYI